MSNINYYNEIKNKLLDNEIYGVVKDYSKERNRVMIYYEVGKLLSEAGKHYGEDIIGNYSKKLVNEVGKKYNKKTLYKMRQFYEVFSKPKFAPMARQLSYSHYIELISLKSEEEILYYISSAINQKVSRNELRQKIKNKEDERLSVGAKSKLIANTNLDINDYIKNPIIINNSTNQIDVSEKILHKLILEDIDNFLKELGTGFCYISSEYKIRIGDFYNYIDLLLFNIEFNCYAVVELKVTNLKKEHIGQIQVYMNFVDKNIKKLNHNKTVGIIICKKDNKYIIEYSSDKRITSREYILI